MLTGKTLGLSGTMQRMAAMNNLPAMTEPQRTELIGRLRIYIRSAETAIKAGLATEEDVFNLDVRKIALAALTAKPIYQVCYRNRWSDTSQDLYQEEVLVNHHAARIRYAAPPAPVLRVPEGWKLVPIEPTEDMVVEGFESEPFEFFSDPEGWEKFEAMSGCQQAAHKARLCYAAMLAAAPEVSEEELNNDLYSSKP